MSNLAKEIISLHGKEGLSADQWFELLIDDVLAGFGLLLTDIPPEPVRAVLFELAGQYAKEVIDAEPFTDLLGPVHMELVSHYHQQASGQFFTPPNICRMLAEISLADFPPDDEPRLIRINDPAVGAGGLLLATLEVISKKHGSELLRWISLTGIDVDRRCVRMFPMQVLSNLFVHRFELGELVAYWGNTLGDPTDWTTVCHYTRRDLPTQPAPADHPEIKTAVAKAISEQSEQLALF